MNTSWKDGCYVKRYLYWRSTLGKHFMVLTELVFSISSIYSPKNGKFRDFLRWPWFQKLKVCYKVSGKKIKPYPSSRTILADSNVVKVIFESPIVAELWWDTFQMHKESYDVRMPNFNISPNFCVQRFKVCKVWEKNQNQIHQQGQFLQILKI